MRLKALLVEDDLDIQDLLKSQVESLGLDVICTSNGKTAIDLIKENTFDIFLLDRMLPGATGMEVCNYIRSHDLYSSNPILMITALTQPEQIIEGLNAGADDYITKPFDINILLARLRCELRRYHLIKSKKENISKLELGALSIDIQKRVFLLQEKEVQLTKSEFNLMTILLKNVGKVMSRKELKLVIQGDAVHVTDRTIDTHIFGLRKKLKHYSSQVESIRGIGYRINEKL